MKYFGYSIFYITVSLLLTSCYTVVSIHANQGKLDLRGIDFEKKAINKLDGIWDFYWEQLLTPADFGKRSDVTKPAKMPVPLSWTDAPAQSYLTYGYATYRLQVLIPAQRQKYGIFIPKIWNASKVWVNDSLVHEIGRVGKSFADYENKILEKLIAIEAAHQINITVQVANYDFFTAGLLQSFQLGNYQSLYEKTAFVSLWTLMWIGCLLVMSLYHFVLYLFRKNNVSTLFFALICLLIAVRLMVFGDHFLYEYLKEHWGVLNFAVQSKTYYTATFLLIPLALSYIGFLYPDETSKKVILAGKLLTGVYCTFLLLAPPRLFSPTILYYQAVIGVFVLYLIFVLIKATIRRRKEAWLQMAGIFTVILAGINDGLYSQGIVIIDLDEMLPVAFAVFLLLQIFIIAKRFSNAFNEVEDLSINLEKKVVERTLEVTQQKHEIEKKNEDITASINYAKTIQSAILPTQDEITRFLPEHFILFKPKSIVSGDFYWFQHIGEDLLVIAAADCTGHGVPGAFMSMVGNDLLNEIIMARGIIKPHQILYELHKGVRYALKQEENKNHDGMDIAICTINLSHKRLLYAGAMNPLYYIQTNEKSEAQLIEIKADKKNIGGHQKEAERIFTSHEISIEQPTTFYIFSDGYQDQFGGEEGRKFMTKRFRELLFSVHHLPLSKQQYLLNQTLNEWMGANHKQIDDVLVIGVRLGQNL
jgi:serine phosphatase RsbU (regulator of sigma subunit)